MVRYLFGPILLLLANFAYADNERICDKDDGGPVECYTYALGYTYRMCHQVESIAVIEYGLLEAHQGTNGKKYEFCVDKQKRKVSQLFKAAVDYVRANAALVSMVKELQAFWEESLAELPGRPDELIEHYQTRVLAPYITIVEDGGELRQAVQEFLSSGGAAKSPRARQVARTR